MAKRIIPPIRLQPDTSLIDAYAQIDLNFENMIASFSGFSLEVASVAGGGDTLAPGVLNFDAAYVYMRETVDDLVFIHPTISLYIDIPSVEDFDVFNPPNEYLFPTGSSITPDGFGMISSTVLGATTGATIFPDAPDPTYDGVTYRLGNPIIHSIRNGTATPHTYFVLITYFAYSKSQSFYR